MTSAYAISTGGRVVRNLAYGAAAVALGISLSERGLRAEQVGTIFSVALLSGATFSMSAGRLERFAGARLTLILGAVSMAVTGAILASAHTFGMFLIAALLGALSPGAQEVGPFAAIEQTLVAHSSTSRTTVHLAWYNLAGNFAVALGALFAAFVAPLVTLVAYAGAGGILAVLYALLPVEKPAMISAHPATTHWNWGAIEKLTLLFGIDALAGGFVVQGFLVYWFHERFGVGADALGRLLFGANTLAALSFLAAPAIAARVGLLRTMVYTHLPSNVLLAAVPLMPTFELAATALLARSLLSQMDVPTRQAYTMAIVAPHERARAAGLTSGIRPAAAAVAPVLAGLAVQGAAFGVPFFVAGTLKIAYDLTIFSIFRDVRLASEDV